MRIYSEFGDYYDHIAHYSNEDRIWERHTRTIQLNINKNQDRTYTGITTTTETKLIELVSNLPGISVGGGRVYSESIDDFVGFFGFCGTLQVIIIHYTGKHFVVFTDFDEYVAAFQKNRPNHKLIIDKNSHFMWSNPFNKEYLTNLTAQYCKPNQYQDIFIEVQSPLFLVKRTRGGYHNHAGFESNFIVSPCLKDYNFQSIIDPYQANQEIDMYLNNVLTTRENPDIFRTDELIRDSKGMDNWSFKQIGPKARKRKKC